MTTSSTSSMKNKFRREVQAGLKRINSLKPLIINENNFSHLPPIVKKYLEYSGVIGREELFNVRIEFEGKIRSKSGDPWMKFNSVQYNFFDKPTRIFYIKAFKMGVPAVGIHLYKDETAIMVIKLAGLFKIVDAKGKEMNQGETVTVFNDMCCMAPATLINKNIQWEIVDPLTVKAKFTNGNISIEATLFFNDIGELVNFVSNDRFETADGKIYKNYPWSTPVNEYREYKGQRIPFSASTVYHRPDSDFCYGEFILKEIEYNCRNLK